MNACKHGTPSRHDLRLSVRIRVSALLCDGQGVKHAVPKTILQLMNVEGMTRENVASHLQKYRLYLKRLAGYPSAARLPLDTLQQVQQACLSPLANTHYLLVARNITTEMLLLRVQAFNFRILFWSFLRAKAGNGLHALLLRSACLLF